MAKNQTTKTTKKKNIRVVSKGRIYVSATFNNTIASITDDKGNVLCWASTGEAGFRGSRKSTPYAATVTIENVVNKAKDYGIKEMAVFLKGPGTGREVALRVLRAKGIRMSMIADVTPEPHNGTRPRKAKHNR